MPSSQLYRDGRQRFIKETKERYQKSKDLEMLQNFLMQSGSPQDAKATALALQQKAAGKWDSASLGGAEIPSAWIEKLMSNMSYFVTAGDYAMKGAPESVGLAWCAVKLTLSAIHNNFDLYTFFGSALTDISEIMILIPHYDELYDERTKGDQWKASPIVEKLFQDIIDAYTAVLNFSFSIQRHLGAGTLARLKHGLKDFFGVSKAAFEGSMATIAAYKNKIIEDSQAIFQDKSLHQIDTVKGIVSGIEDTVKDIVKFQDTLRVMQEEQAARWAIVLEKMADMKSATKPKTPWDYATQTFEKNKAMLNPEDDTIDALGDALDRRHQGTCNWIFECSSYTQWQNSMTHGIFCIHGLEDSGKTTVLATVVERLDQEKSNDTILIYMNCGPHGRGAAAKSLTVDAVYNTLLYLLYNYARRDEDDLKLLEDCNNVFAIQKEKAKARSMAAIINDETTDSLPEFVYAFLAIATRLDANVIVAIDEVDRLGISEQQELSAKMQGVLNSANYGSQAMRTIQFLIGCRSTSKFVAHVQNTKNSLWSVDVGKSNGEDMRQTLQDALQNIPGLTSNERIEAENAILKKAGPRFGYIGGIGIPFMREPFLRPLSERLDSLPQGMDSVYDDALSKMSANYIELLRTALLWSLFAPVPLRLSEIMDAYHGIYKKRGPEAEDEANALALAGFPKSSVVEIEQLQDACGPFLRLEAEVSSDDYIVQLQDPSQVRDFCLRPDTEHAQVVADETHVCNRCKTRTNASNHVKISAKEAHLKLALECLRSMNNPSFQKRSTATSPYPLWTPYMPEADVSALQDGAEEYNEANEEEYDEDNEEEYDEDGVTDDREDSVEDGAQNGVEDGVEDGAATASAPWITYGNLHLDESEIAQIAEISIEEVAEIDIDMLEPEYMIDFSQDPSRDSESGERDESKKQNRDDANESQDDEDRDELYLADEPSTINNTNSEQATRLRTYRYESRFWYYHVQQAEALWSPAEREGNKDWMSLFDELDYWTDNGVQWFNQWQTWDPKLAKYDGILQPLHVAAYLGLTSWVSHLLLGGAEIDAVPFGMAETPLQVAGNRVNSVEMLELLLQAKADPNLAYDESTPAFHKWLMKRSDMANVQLMLRHGADPTLANDSNGWTALHCFAWQGQDVATLDRLLNHNPDGIKPNINAHDKRGNTPLHVLLWRREVPKTLLEAFVSRGADINEENNDSVRPLQMACLYGDIETLKVLCKGDVKEVNDEDHEGDTALQQAAISNHTECVEFLLKFGANPNVQNHNGKVALHHAALRGTKECLETLLQHGAKPNVHDKHDRTPFFCACLDRTSQDKAMILLNVLMERRLSLAEINVSTENKRTPLREAAGHGFGQVVKTLIQIAKATNDFASLALNEGDTRKGMTPLHRAAWLGHFECVQLLIAAKANVYLLDQNGKSALVLAYEQWALTGQHKVFEDIVSLLIDVGPVPAAFDPELAAVCAINGSLKLLRKLGGIGADFNRPDQYGWTPMELAQYHSQAEARHFLQQQAAWSGMLPSGWTANGRNWTANSGTLIVENGTRVEHVSGKRICISTDKPLPAGLEKFYFEITIESANGDIFDESNFPVLAVGFCTIGGSAISFPGWPPRGTAPSARSWGYHGHDGGVYASGQESRDGWMTGLRYRSGQTVGCGVNLATETMWFTRDGQRLGSEIKGVHGRLFPVLGVKDEVVVNTNFKGPFRWQE